MEKGPVLHECQRGRGGEGGGLQVGGGGRKVDRGSG